MKNQVMICPCCGQKINIMVSEDVVAGVFSDIPVKATAEKLVSLGLELGLLKGGENENGE